MLPDWSLYPVAALLAATTYVQAVGRYFENYSGIRRIDNLETYRRLFGGPPWIAWYMFRWSGVIHLLGLVLISFSAGIIAALMLGIALIGLALLTKGIAEKHARSMANQVLKEGPHRLSAHSRTDKL